MKHTRPNLSSGNLRKTATLALLFIIALTPGCGSQKSANRAEEEKQFLAPTDVNKLRPEAREALRHLPGGGKIQPTTSTGPK